MLLKTLSSLGALGGPCIAIVAGTYQPQRCGVAHYTACLRDTLSKQGIQSVILTTYSAAQSASDPNVKGVVQNWQLADLLPLMQAVHDSCVDVLHIQHAAGTYGFERAVFLLPLLLRATGWHGKIVTTVHEYGWWEWQPKGIPPQFLEWLKMWGQRRGWWDREDGFLLTLSNAVITTNTDAEAVIHKRLPELSKCMYSIPIAANIEVAPINRDLAQQMLRKNCRWSDGSVVIAFFGFLHPVKGLETLLPAFKQVVALQPQARLLLVGGVESLALRAEDAKLYWDKLHALVAELDLLHLVHLTGYMSAETASHYLSGVDIGVLPFNHGVTLKSGSLMALLAHGLPVVATQLTSLPNRCPVRLVPPRDISALATGLMELVNNPAMRVQLGEAGCAFIQDFSWQDIGRSHRSVYENLYRKF